MAVANSNESKKQLFQGAYLAKFSAKEKQAAFLAPQTYAAADKALLSAEKAYKKNKPVEKVKGSLVEAIRQYEMAEVRVDQATEVLASVLGARQAAMAMNAHTLQPKEWESAESILNKAILSLEKGKKPKAKSQQIKAAAIYRDIELIAIKAEYLDETRALIAEAKKAKIVKRAPITLRKAQELLATAEIELTENRYDVDLPRSYAKEARYEAKHAFYISELIKQNRKADLSEEQILLAAEEPLQKVSAAADIQARFDNGVAPVSDAMVLYIEKLKEELQELKQQLSEKDQRVASMSTLINEFSKHYGGAESSMQNLEKYIALQDELRRRIKTLETMFDRQEVRVFREKNEVYLRLVGLHFESGSTKVGPENDALLLKVVNALKLYPNSKIVVEGHTDSFGSNDSNLILSKNRAESVKRHLVYRSTLPESQVEAQGFGETRPFANNDTPQGRAMNRRIDIKIIPKAI